MKPFQAYRLDRTFEKVKLPDITLEVMKVSATPLYKVWAISPEEALKTAQSDHPFPHRLCVGPLES